MNFGKINARYNACGISVGAPSTALIRNCYNVGETIYGESTFGSAGIVCGNSGSIENCYNVGVCNSSKYNLVYNNTGTITNSYYLHQQTEGGKTIDEIFMKSQEFVDMLNTDTETGKNTDAYTMDTIGINNGYPILKWQLEN